MRCCVTNFFFYATAAPKEKDSDEKEEKEKKRKKDETGNKDAKVPKKGESKSTGEQVFIGLMVGGMLHSGADFVLQFGNHRKKCYCCIIILTFSFIVFFLIFTKLCYLLLIKQISRCQVT